VAQDAAALSRELLEHLERGNVDGARDGAGDHAASFSLIRRGRFEIAGFEEFERR